MKTRLLAFLVCLFSPWGWDLCSGATPADAVTVTPVAGAHGTISPNERYRLRPGDVLAFKAAPEPGYDVEAWSVNGVVVQTGGAHYLLSDTRGDRTVAVQFARLPGGVAPRVAAPGPATPELSPPVYPGVSSDPTRLPPGVRVLRDLFYVEGGHEQNRLDLYLPRETAGPLPVVVWIHGGAWNSGSKAACLVECAWLAARGYAVAGIDYRLSQHAPFPAQIEDCKAAVRWLRAHAAEYGLDPDHIGAWGFSAGGHLAAMLGVTGDVAALEGLGGNRDQSSRVQCVLDWYGRTDLSVADSQNDADVTAAVSQLLGGPLDENRDKARRASPLSYVSSSAAPFLILHGDHDQRVPLKQSELLADALKRAGVDVTLRVIRGAGHGGADFWRTENLKLVENFLAAHLALHREGRGLTSPGNVRE
jgi:acetyl esterase/lipase